MSIDTVKFPAVLIAAFVSCSCSVIPDGSSRLTMSAACRPMTKLVNVSEDDESRMNETFFFIFDEEGNLESSICSDESSEQRTSVKNGKKHIYAVVNAGLTEMPEKERDLLATVTFLSENRPGDLIMFGKVSMDIEHDQRLAIVVKRLVSKVVIKEIAVDFKNSSPFNSLSIRSIYLINVNSRINLDGNGQAPAEEWFNPGGRFSGDADFILAEGLDLNVSDGESHDILHTFYAYPNATLEDNSDTDCFSPRFTRLVIDTDMGFYAIDLPGLKSNNSYTIPKVTITARGADNPESGPDRNACTARIIVSDWDGEFTYSETI